VVSWRFSGLVELFLFQVELREPFVYVSVGLLLVSTGLAAALVPARPAASESIPSLLFRSSEGPTTYSE
jgi:hypothetical protein